VKPPAVAATPESTRLRSMLWLYGVPTIFVLLWSSGFTFAKMGLEQASPFALLSLRYSLVLLILSPLYIWLRPPLPASRRAFGHVVVVGILIQVFFFGGTYVAITHGVSAGTVGLIFVFQPILVSVLAPKLTNERVNLGAWTGLCFGLVGAAAVIVARTSVQAPPLFGLAASFVGVAAMAAATLYEKRFGVQQHAVTSNLIQCGVGLVITAPLGLTLEGFHVVWSMKLAVALTYLVLCNSLVAGHATFSDGTTRGSRACIRAILSRTADYSDRGLATHWRGDAAARLGRNARCSDWGDAGASRARKPRAGVGQPQRRMRRSPRPLDPRPRRGLGTAIIWVELSLEVVRD